MFLPHKPHNNDYGTTIPDTNNVPSSTEQPKYILCIDSNTYRCITIDEVKSIYKQKGEDKTGFVYSLSREISMNVELKSIHQDSPRSTGHVTTHGQVF
jgi:hypothetical protein